MPAFTILFGIALMAVGIGTFALSEKQPWVLILPIIYGLVALGLGVGSIVKKDLRMHLMHAAVLIAALGVLIPVIQLISRVVTMWQEDRDRSLTLLAVLLTVAVSGAYVFTAVQSFRAARKDRKDGTPTPPKKDTEPAETTAEP